jgi:DNA-binding response OmpR family regulator
VGLLEKYLRRLGFACDSRRTPDEAFECFDADPEQYHLVITDLSFEDASGEDLALRIMARDARVRILFISGYPYGAEALRAADRQRVAYLQKPFLPEMLQDAIDALLNRPAGATAKRAGASGNG